MEVAFSPNASLLFRKPDSRGWLQRPDALGGEDALRASLRFELKGVLPAQGGIEATFPDTFPEHHNAETRRAFATIPAHDQTSRLRPGHRSPA